MIYIDGDTMKTKLIIIIIAMVLLSGIVFAVGDTIKNKEITVDKTVKDYVNKENMVFSYTETKNENRKYTVCVTAIKDKIETEIRCVHDVRRKDFSKVEQEVINEYVSQEKGKEIPKIKPEKEIIKGEITLK